MDWNASGEYDRHPVRDRRGHREDHDRPARGAQRLPAADHAELIQAFDVARDDPRSASIILTGEGPDAFCCGGDQKSPRRRRLRRRARDRPSERARPADPDPPMPEAGGGDGGRLRHRRRPRAALCCDLTIAADNARFGQTGPRVGSFDAGYGIDLLRHDRPEKRAKEVWFLCRQYDAQHRARHGAW